MKTETLETVIEELASALSLERWRLLQRDEEILKLKREIENLKKGDEIHAEKIH